VTLSLSIKRSTWASGEGIGAFLFDGVLCRHHKERAGESKGFVPDRHLPLLHGFEQGGLDFGGSAVDLVCKDDIRKDRSFFDRKSTFLLFVDLCSKDIRRQHIGSELEPLKACIQSIREGLDNGGFGESGDTFDEDMPVGKETNKQAFDKVLLTDDHFADGLAEPLNELTFFSDLFLDIACGSAFCHLCFLWVIASFLLRQRDSLSRHLRPVKLDCLLDLCIAIR
jgi:hypothetical protein